MVSSKLNPVARAGADRARELFTAANVSENIFSAPNLQAFRVAHLARRFRLSPLAASFVAGLCYGEARG